MAHLHGLAQFDVLVPQPALFERALRRAVLWRRRSFGSRLSHSESLGNGFNWHVEQWPYLIKDFSGNVVIQGAPNTSLWFDKTVAGFVGRFHIKQTLVLDAVGEVYRLYSRDGSHSGLFP